jgi:hypothetical protein
MIIECKNNTT